MLGLNLDDKDLLIEIFIWITASVSFGCWQHSIFAGIFFALAFFLYNRSNSY